MESSRRALLAMTALCAVAFAQAAGGQIFKCQDAQGRIIYQQKLCEGAAKESGVNASQAPAAANPRGPIDAKSAPSTSTGQTAEPSVLMFLVQKRQCDLGHPEIARQTKASYDRWRDRNAKEIAEVEGNANYRTLLDDARRTPNPLVTPGQLDKVCQDVVQHLGDIDDPRRQRAR
jgi:hypothetical protein